METPPVKTVLDRLCESDIIRAEDWFLLAPVKAGLIRYTDLKDGSVDFRDVVVLNEMLRIQDAVNSYYIQLSATERETKSVIRKR